MKFCENPFKYAYLAPQGVLRWGIYMRKTLLIFGIALRLKQQENL